MRWLLGRRLVGVLLFRDHEVVEHFGRVAIDGPQPAILAANDEQATRLAVDLRIDDRAGLREVPVVGVVRHELPRQDQLAGLHIEGRGGIGPLVGAGTQVAVEIRRRIADRNKQHALQRSSDTGVQKLPPPWAMASAEPQLFAPGASGAGSTP